MLFNQDEKKALAKKQFEGILQPYSKTGKYSLDH
ncbi:MAG: hypothetical protein JWP71_1316 [Mucilaginibacter sp.]|nr:hypothetical protein [Mucilaginibacter sp.]